MLIRRSLEQQGFSPSVIDTMLKCRREKSVSLYDSYLNKWNDFCNDRKLDPIYASVQNVLDFLQFLFDDNSRGASAIGTARSALSSVVILPDGSKVGENVFVKQFIRGIKSLKPAKPRYLSTWDPQLVIDMFLTDDWNSAKDLSLLALSAKTVMLILLATFQRGQIIVALNLDRMIMLEDEIRFEILASEVKQGSRNNFKPEPIIFKKIDEARICIYEHVRVYLDRTSDVRGDVKQLFVISRKPFNAVSRDSVSHWVKSVMREAGIDVDVFAPGSTRSASASGAFLSGVPLEHIMKMAGWSQSATFMKWYKR